MLGKAIPGSYAGVKRPATAHFFINHSCTLCARIPQGSGQNPMLVRMIFRTANGFSDDFLAYVYKVVNISVNTAGTVCTGCIYVGCIPIYLCVYFIGVRTTGVLLSALILHAAESESFVDKSIYS
jgi:hypothetical protein